MRAKPLFIGLLSIAILLFPCIVQSGSFEIKSNLGPATTSTSPVDLDAPGSELYNCLQFVHVVSSNIYTVDILDGTTTDYHSVMAAGEPFIINSRIDESFCASASTTTSIHVTPAASTNYFINYKGFVRK